MVIYHDAIFCNDLVKWRSLVCSQVSMSGTGRKRRIYDLVIIYILEL